MARTAWIFEDEAASQVYEFPINPREATMPAVSKTFTPVPTTRGRSLLFQGREQSSLITLSGTLLTEEEYLAFREWSQKDRQIKITDDLGRVYWVVIKTFTPRRVRSIEYPWRHEFTITCVVVNWS
jgi:hypothetical protein